MTSEIIAQLINKRLVIDFVLILIAYFLVDLINMKLGFQILGIKMSWRQILPGMLLLIFYNLFGKLFLPGLAYGLFLITILILIIRLTGGKTVPWFRALWASFLVASISSIGVAAIQIPLLLNKEISNYMLKQPVGVALGSLCELVAPLIMLYVLHTFKLSLIPLFGRKLTKLDTWSLSLFGTMFFVSYSIFIVFVLSIESSPKFILIVVVVIALLLTFGEAVAYHVIRTLTRKERDDEEQQYEAELRMNQEKMQKLEAQNQRLNELIDELHATKAQPGKVIDSIENVIGQLRGYYDSLTLQKNSALVFEGDDFTKITFSDTEISIIELIIQGKTNQEIGQIIHLSPGRVANIISELLSKTGSKDRTVLAVRYAIQKYSSK